MRVASSCMMVACMSTTSSGTLQSGASPVDSPAPPIDSARRPAPIVPRATIAGRALMGVVAIMTFLASLTTGAVVLVRSAADQWQAGVARGLTPPVRAGRGRGFGGAGVSLDGPPSFVARMRAMSGAALLVGIAVLFLVLLATMLSVTFATRAA